VSVVYNSCWISPAQSFSGPSPVGLVAIFYFLRFETSLFVASYDSQGHGGGIRPRLHMGIKVTLLLQLSSLEPHCMDRVENAFSNSTSIVVCLSVAAGTCLPSRCLEMNVVSEKFASYSCFSGSTVLALSKYDTVGPDATACLSRGCTAAVGIENVTVVATLLLRFLC
jgi:hypothetical protein